MTSNVALALALVLALAGCGVDLDEVEVDPADSERAFAFGAVSEAGALEPWQDGERVEVVVGVQGFEMISFHVEAAIEPGDPDGEDWCVRTTFTQDPIDPFAGMSSYCHGVDVEVIDGRVRLGPVLRILTTKEVRGEQATLAVELSTSSFTSVEVRTLELY